MTRKSRIPVKRYNMRLPEVVYDELEAIARRKGIPTSDLLRSFIKLGLVAVHAEEKPDMGLFIRDGAEVQRVVLV